ncbi:MAG: hypothetical protein LQ347_002383 [Umbilicaria vellea]|nr:MAG: hypothetical protein LQ347_002383 [Umbilicaria vellea]
MSKSDFSQNLLASSSRPQNAAEKIPIIARHAVSERAKQTLNLVEKFVDEECIPADTVFHAQLGEGEKRWSTYPPIIDDLKARAKKLGLWNMFLPKNHFSQGAGFSNLEYGLMAEYLGRSRTASEATNCAAPDTGNMEVIAKYGTDAQKKEWLAPLLEGKIRSAFLMTEPDVASSDATNIRLTMRKEGNEYVLNGSKWWSSGAGDPRCKIYIVMGKSDPNNKDVYRQQSVMLVPAGTKGITVKRMLSVYGFDDAPHGHGHITFENVRVPASSMVLGEGRGFEIIQGRLGPGRIHHAMRAIGAAEKALEWMLARINDPKKKPFGKNLSEHGVILEWVAKSRVEIDAARLIVLNAAIKIDEKDAKSALKEIAQAKVLVPTMALTVIDRAVQSFGAAGICQDTPLANMWAQTRTLRIVDGPDEVHLQQLGKNENKRGKEVTERLDRQMQAADALMRQYNMNPKAHLSRNRTSTRYPEQRPQSLAFLKSTNPIKFRIELPNIPSSPITTQPKHPRTPTPTQPHTYTHPTTYTHTSTTMSSNVLSSRDVNTSAPSPTKPTDANKPQSMEYHRQVLQSRLEENKAQQTYISPSDTIMSPCTAKLSAYKSKHFMKAKPQSLFAKTSSKNLAAGSSAANPFGGEEKSEEEKK